jgi:hypothetical protein
MIGDIDLIEGASKKASQIKKDLNALIELSDLNELEREMIQ